MDQSLLAGTEEKTADLTKDEKRQVTARGRPSAPVIYEVIRRDGHEELNRPAASLMWSGIAAGILISLSVYAEALFHAALPDVPWRGLIENLGYSVGFLVVILGRMQLFTENTITTVVPVLTQPSRRNTIKMLSLWGIVFGANLVGTMLMATVFAYSDLLAPEVKDAVLALSEKMMAHDWVQMVVRGVLAGIIIATLVWLLPNVPNGQFWAIILLTYMIALGDLTHVVAGSVEAGYLVMTGNLGAAEMVLRFLIPAFIGNVLGGTAVFTMLVYAQIKHELRSNKADAAQPSGYPFR
ncbi:MAG: formate/nitrite transporter family protein [Neomegalonema sp.]|nr:formate/nitrite transporter family protein [Neomegalonema sp.]